MKKVLFLLLLTIASYGQTYQNPTFGTVKLKTSPTVTNPDYLTTTETDGTQGKVLSNAYIKSDRTININGVAQDLSADRDWQTGYADTGVLTFAGMTPNSSTTINIGACKGWVIDNETNPLVPTKVFVDYAGETNKAVPAVGSAIGSYVLLNGSGITFITTQPTPAQRKTHMYLGKVGHPSGTITVVANTPDVAISPLGYTRALYNALNFINEGVRVAPNGANLNINLASGYITGSGINFVTDNTTPNRLTVNPQTPATFIYRTQTGAGGGATTTVTPGNYDVGGVVTAIPGGANTSTIQYVFYAPGAGVFIQLGQNIYASLSDAVAAADKEVFTIYPNFIDNVILIGQIVLTKSATNLSNTTQAVFLKASKLGETGGSNSGISTATLQSAYNNSLIPQIITSSALGAMTYRRGSASDSDNIIVGQNGAGTNTFEVKGNGTMTLGNGTTAIPSISFNNEIAPNTGFNHPSDGNIDIINNGNITSKHTSVSSEFFVPVTGTLFIKSGSTASNILLAGGTDIPQSTFAPASGSANYIQNQNASAQSANFWINGTGRFTSPAAEIIRLTRTGGADWAFELGGSNDIYFRNKSNNTVVFSLVNGVANIPNLSGTGTRTVVADASGNLSATNTLNDLTLTGTPTAPTATAGTNTTQIATTAFVQAANGGYKTATLRMSQSSTSIPTSVSMYNDTSIIPSSPTWERNGVGDYRFFVGTMDATKVFPYVVQSTYNSTGSKIYSATIQGQYIQILAKNAGTAEDGASNLLVEIRQYP